MSSFPLNYNDLSASVRNSDNANLIGYATEASIAFKNNEIPDEPNWFGIGVMIEELAARLHAMKAVIEKLPRTKDGVNAIPGMEVFPPCGHNQFTVPKYLKIHTCCEGTCRIEDFGENDYHDVWYKDYSVEQCYSTRELAEAAIANKEVKP